MTNTEKTLALTNHAAELARLRSATAGLVMNARNNGASWAEIGVALGITRQAAQQKYGAIDTEPASRKVAAKAPAKASKNVDTPAPAKAPRLRKPNATTTQRGYTDTRPEFVLRSAGMINGVPQPGTGKGPHTCPRCGSTNHKSGKPDVYTAYVDCTPTKYDPQDITDQLNQTSFLRRN